MPCHRCGDALLCAVRAPHSFLRTDGTEVSGTRTVGLCAGCDKENPAARALIDYFAGCGEVVSEPEAATLLGDWLREVLPARIDDAQLAMLQTDGTVRT
ncbi:DUF6300 family protein [Nocardia suismassiliense]|uniref:DUF6300 family protein n=1 Tax=Nocardia suismassiliense TaxID=2077092 RepID=A0ABW6R436_9NOCA